ncbi:MAG: hypothetical protein AB1898_12430 [Acidobacteriota bacterium]
MKSPRFASWYLSCFAALLLLTASQLSIARNAVERLSDDQFIALIDRVSEDPGFFNSDNLVSNESSYLQVADKLEALKVRGGVYLGVGPEQNFTYIARTRPSLAIIVDIRRQNQLYHLLFKALFESSRDRLEYLSLLFCRPLSVNLKWQRERDVESLMAVLEAIAPEERLYEKNFEKLESHIRRQQKFDLTAADSNALREIYREFFDRQMEIRFRSYGRPSHNYYPTFKEISLEKNLNGDYGNYLSSEDDFQFLKNLHSRNLIVPVVGDFAGTKTLKAIGKYLEEIGETLSVFYVSNVEFYLIQNGVFRQYGENIKALPIDDNSLFIRAYFRFPHPERLPGYISATLLQRVASFLELLNAGRYHSYQDLGLMDYLGFRE